LGLLLNLADLVTEAFYIPEFRRLCRMIGLKADRYTKFTFFTVSNLCALRTYLQFIMFLENGFSCGLVSISLLSFQGYRSVWRESRQAVKVVTVVSTKPRPLIRISGETGHW
jgi:hypothetical protein